MSGTVTLVTDRMTFAPMWRSALEHHGLTAREASPDHIASHVAHNAPIIVDAGSEAFDEDEILTAVGFARAEGAITVVHLPDSGAMSSVDDLIDEMCCGLIARSQHDVTRLAASIARRLDMSRTRRFEFVTVSPRGGEILAILGDGQAEILKRPVGETDDGSEILSIELGEDAGSAALSLASGARLELRPPERSIRKTLNGDNGITIDGARLGAKLRELRLAAGLTQAELARRTGIHRPNIARVEAGRHTPSLDTLSRLASAIGVSATRVLSED